jgi:CBS domain containing-hemolysin-like protein
MDDDASTVFTDLRASACVLVGHRDGVDQTLHVMQRAGVRMVFVGGADGELIGHVTSDDLQGERPVVRALAQGLRHEELTVEDLMTPVSRWHVLDFNQLSHASVGNIVATLREHSLRYLLVTEMRDGRPSLRGLFSARRIELALKTLIDGDLHLSTFAALEAALVGR